MATRLKGLGAHRIPLRLARAKTRAHVGSGGNAPSSGLTLGCQWRQRVVGCL